MGLEPHFIGAQAVFFWRNPYVIFERCIHHGRCRTSPDVGRIWVTAA
jgi:hypothetical protein